MRTGLAAHSADPDIHRAILINRPHRTAFDVPILLTDVDPDDETSLEPPDIVGASASAMATADLIDAQNHLDNQRLDHAHPALDSAEGSLAQALLTLHLLRLQVRGFTEAVHYARVAGRQ